MEKKLRTEGFLFIFLAALCWGPSYLFIKIALPDIPPLTLTFIRVVIAFVVFYGLSLFRKLSLWDWKQHWKIFLILGILVNACPALFIALGELFISSSLAGILNSLLLIFTAILSHFFGLRESLTTRKMGGIGFGIAGLVAIYLPLILKKGTAESFWGALLIILACLSMGIGTVYARTHLQKNIPPFALLTAQCFFASLILLPFSLAFDHPFSLPIPSVQAIFGAVSLGVIGTSAGFYFYYQAIQKAGATYATLSLLLVPILAIILGICFLHETIEWNTYLGTALILIGVFLVNPVKKNRIDSGAAF